MDIVDQPTRSRMMSRIRGTDTGPERRVRSYLHRQGFRFRIHRRDLPGRPDIVLPRYRLVILVHGCFWHRHPHCSLATTPATNHATWQAKFQGNVDRDQRNIAQLQESGWRVLVLWECGLRHKEAADLVWLNQWISGDERYREWPCLP